MVDFGGNEEVTESGTDMSTRVAGVISTNPAYLMNSNLENSATGYVVSVALTGRVPTKVHGTVNKGDLMVTSGERLGHARAATPTEVVVGSIIGKALQDYEDPNISGIIEVVVGKH